MQFFDRDGKFNWVDENNVLVGFDSAPQSCEDFGWFVAEKPTVQDPTAHAPAADKDPEWGILEFDKDFFVEASYREGFIVIFKLRRTQPPAGDMYLHLYNVHEGYYAHGFTMTAPGLERSGDL